MGIDTLHFARKRKGKEKQRGKEMRRGEKEEKEQEEKEEEKRREQKKVQQLQPSANHRTGAAVATDEAVLPPSLPPIWVTLFLK